MRQSEKYRIVFDENGKVYFSDAPFLKLNNESFIGDYLPMFMDKDIYSNIASQPLHPYEFSVNKERYLVDFELDKLYKNDELFYDLSITNRTGVYENLQKERTAKNTYRIEGEELRQINRRLKVRIYELEDMMKYVLGEELKTPVGNIKNSLEHIQTSEIEEDRKQKLLNLAYQELSHIESMIEAFSEVNEISDSSTFEESYYCSVSEILECIKNKLQTLNIPKFSADFSDENLFYVNKFHFANIIISLIDNLIYSSTKAIDELQLSSTLECKDNSRLGFSVILKFQDDEREAYSPRGTELKRSVMSKLKATKLAELYNGEITISNPSESVSRAELSFANLLFRKKK